MNDNKYGEPKPGRLFVNQNGLRMLKYTTASGMSAEHRIGDQTSCSPGIKKWRGDKGSSVEVEYFLASKSSLPIPRMKGEAWDPSMLETVTPATAGRAVGGNAGGQVRPVGGGVPLARTPAPANDNYPYNFISAPRDPAPEKTAPMSGDNIYENIANLVNQCPEIDQSVFRTDTHTGEFEIEMLILSPTIVSHPPEMDGVLSENDFNQVRAVLELARQNDPHFGTCQMGNNPIQNLQRIRPFFQTAPGKYMIPATSIKGMLRSLVEAISHSHMGVVSEELKGVPGGNAYGSRCLPRGHSRADLVGLHNEHDVTRYNFGFHRQPPPGNWDHWVTSGFTPWAKLGHVNGSVNPQTTTLADRMFGRVVKGSDGDSGSEYPNIKGRVRVMDALGWDSDGNSTAWAADEFWFLKTLTQPEGAKAKCEALYLDPLPNGQADVYATGIVGNPRAQMRGFKVYKPHSLGSPNDPKARSLRRIQSLICGKTVDECRNTPEIASAVEAFRAAVRGRTNDHGPAKSWVKPVLPGSTFRFKIKFNDLSDIELGALARALLLFNQPAHGFGDALFCHRIGRGKPLGFGSVVLNIVKTSEYGLSSSYESLLPIPPVEPSLDNALSAFAAFCGQWNQQMERQVSALFRIPEVITEYRYWPNFPDFQRGARRPIPRY